MTVGSLVIVRLRPIRAAACDSPDGQHDALAAADEIVLSSFATSLASICFGEPVGDASRYHLDRQLLQAPVAFGSLTAAPGLRQLRSKPACLIVCVPIGHFLHRPNSLSPRPIPPAERSALPTRLARRTSLTAPQCHVRYTFCIVGTYPQSADREVDLVRL
jgi:hypothetical protein